MTRAERWKALQTRKARRGQCARCPAKAEPDRSRCARCLAADSARRLAKYKATFTPKRIYRCCVCGGPRHNAKTCEAPRLAKAVRRPKGLVKA